MGWRGFDGEGDVGGLGFGDWVLSFGCGICRWEGVLGWEVVKAYSCHWVSVILDFDLLLTECSCDWNLVLIWIVILELNGNTWKEFQR